MLAISRSKSVAMGFGLLFSFTLAAQAAEPDQFDLICTGTKTDIKRQQSPWTLHLNVDLRNGQFCFAGCKIASSIARVEPGVIYFIDSVRSGASSQLFVDRGDGSISEIAIVRSVPIIARSKGTCTVGPFTPLPTRLF